jgi:excisionase family DNA binding protein
VQRSASVIRTRSSDAGSQNHALSSTFLADRGPSAALVQPYALGCSSASARAEDHCEYESLSCSLVPTASGIHQASVMPDRPDEGTTHRFPSTEVHQVKHTAAAQTLPPARRLYGVAELAELLSVTTKCIWDLLYAGQLASVKLGRRRLIPAEEVERFLANLSESDSTPTTQSRQEDAQPSPRPRKSATPRSRK